MRRIRAARTELLEHARRRLTLLAEQMFARFSLLRDREEVEDVFQEAMVRLWKALQEVGPTTVAGFMGLAALQMRRALRDLARRHFGRNPGNQADAKPRPLVTAAPGGSLDDHAASDSAAPDELACWSEFHAAVDKLPEPEKTAFDLLYYHELPQGQRALLR